MHPLRLCSSICSCDIYTTTRNSITLNTENLKDCFFDLQCVYSCPVGAITIRPEKEAGQ
jgi:NAD-dependent dihydropyrimidine dehydrogenase PreA subunit